MTDEEMARMERNMQFIVEQQAQFAADMQQFRADMQQVREVLSSQNQAIVSVVGMVGRLAEVQSEFQKNVDARFTRLEDKLTEYGELAKGTENRLNAFITYVEKYISSRDGGNKGKRRRPLN